MALHETGGTNVLWGVDTLDEDESGERLGCCVCGDVGSFLLSCVDFDEGQMEAYVVCVNDAQFVHEVMLTLRELQTA